MRRSEALDDNVVVQGLASTFRIDIECDGERTVRFNSNGSIEVRSESITHVDVEVGMPTARECEGARS